MISNIQHKIITKINRMKQTGNFEQLNKILKLWNLEKLNILEQPVRDKIESNEQPFQDIIETINKKYSNNI